MRKIFIPILVAIIVLVGLVSYASAKEIFLFDKVVDRVSERILENFGLENVGWGNDRGPARADFNPASINQDLVPDTANSYDVGTQALPFNDGNFAGTLRVSSTAFSGNLLPASNNAYTIGSPSLQWAGLYTDDLFVNSIVSSSLSVQGNVDPSADNLYDVGTSSTQWRYGNFQGGLLVADGSTTSTLSPTTLSLTNASAVSSTSITGSSLTLGSGTGYNSGMFNVNSNGNVSASGTVGLFNAINWKAGSAMTAGNYQIARDADTINQLHFNVPTGAGYEWSINDTALMKLSATEISFSHGSNYLFRGLSTGVPFVFELWNGTGNKDVLTITSSERVGINDTNPSAAFTVAKGNILVGNGSVSSTLAGGFLAIATSTTDKLGKFYVDSSGNMSASGSVYIFSNATLGDASGDAVSINAATVVAPNLTGAGGDYVCRNSGTGAITFQAANCTVSALKYKTDIKHYSDGLSFINQLKPVTYTKKSDGSKHLGFIAEDIAKIDERAVLRVKGELETIDYNSLLAPMTKAIQELDDKIDGKTPVSTTNKTLYVALGLLVVLNLILLIKRKAP